LPYGALRIKTPFAAAVGGGWCGGAMREREKREKKREKEREKERKRERKERKRESEQERESLAARHAEGLGFRV
jgi:hypothetical protein